ncbi:hypothetical protein AKO1_014965 [Acrasis kona]|uniref:Uncharacterized protein n=1 Tax=Acrasis kona TaxID=1008807 RepID=A0AAW2Z2V2_9EUKA
MSGGVIFAVAILNILTTFLSMGVCLGMGIYALVLYGDLNGASPNQTDLDTCKASTILKLLLSFGIIDVVYIFFALCSVCGGCFKAYKAYNEEDEGVVSRTTDKATSGSFSCLGLALFALAIAMSVLVWSSECRNTHSQASSNYYFQKMQTFLIIEWVVPFLTGVCVCCVLCTSSIAGGVAVAMNNENRDRV